MKLLTLLTGLLFACQGYAQDTGQVLVFLNSKPNKMDLPVNEQEALQKAHMQNINRLVEDGKLIVAGPFDAGGGIFIFNTSKVSEVKALLTSDPAVRANRWQIEMYPLHYLKGGACAPKKPYEMVSYHFIRVHFINDIANYKMNNNTSDVWQYLQEHSSLLVAGVFPQHNGGFIIYQGEQIENWFGEGQDDMISLVHKTLWVAKGSFCE